MPAYSSPRKRGWRFWLVVFVLFFVLAGIGMSALRFHSSGHSLSVLPTRAFVVAPQPTVTIQITGTSGNIQIQRGTGQTVTVAETIERNFLGSDPRITYTQADPHHLLIIGNADWPNILPENSVTLKVVVPETTNLDLLTGVGDITIQGIQGQLRAQTTSGAISVTETTLRTTGKLQTTAGSILFQGVLALAAHYEFSSTTGSLALVLPATSSFHIDASTIAGAITSTFPGVAVVNKGPIGVGGEIHDDVGNTGQGMSQARLSLHTSIGAISITEAASSETVLMIGDSVQ